MLNENNNESTMHDISEDKSDSINVNSSFNVSIDQSTTSIFCPESPPEMSIRQFNISNALYFKDYMHNTSYVQSGIISLSKRK